MTKHLLLLLIITLSSSITVAQNSTGFSEPENIQSLLDYRLPAWGYSNLYLDFSLNGTRQRSNRENASSINNQYEGEISPLYTRYHESEERISTFILNPMINLVRQDREFFSDQEESGHTLELDTNWNLREQWYREDSNLFFNGHSTGEFVQTDLREETVSQGTTEVDLRELQRSFNTTLSVGIGYGRIRNVNPMIRSLRLNERLQSLQTGQSLGSGDLHQAASHFTRFHGYQQSFDRPQKHFWGDLDPLLTTDLGTLEPFDLLYLTDVTSETIGQRNQGWEVKMAAGIHYSVFYNQESDRVSGLKESQLTQNTFFLPSLSGAWSKNITLKHQLAFQSSVSINIPLHDSSLQTVVHYRARGSWLYTLTDRVLLNAGATYERFGMTSPRSMMLFNSQINYFIEDRFVLFSGLNYFYFPDYENGANMTQDRRSFHFQAGVRYYLMRGLL
ncbi:MAG: hypothetical protein WD355_07280 [Balneolaceae bacterium]